MRFDTELERTPRPENPSIREHPADDRVGPLVGDALPHVDPGRAVPSVTSALLGHRECTLNRRAVRFEPNLRAVPLQEVDHRADHSLGGIVLVEFETEPGHRAPPPALRGEPDPDGAHRLLRPPSVCRRPRPRRRNDVRPVLLTGQCTHRSRTRLRHYLPERHTQEVVSPRPCPCGLPEPFDACCGRCSRLLRRRGAHRRSPHALALRGLRAATSNTCCGPGTPRPAHQALTLDPRSAGRSWRCSTAWAAASSTPTESSNSAPAAGGSAERDPARTQPFRPGGRAVVLPGRNHSLTPERIGVRRWPSGCRHRGPKRTRRSGHHRPDDHTDNGVVRTVTGWVGMTLRVGHRGLAVSSRFVVPFGKLLGQIAPRR